MRRMLAAALLFLAVAAMGCVDSTRRPNGTASTSGLAGGSASTAGSNAGGEIGGTTGAVAPGDGGCPPAAQQAVEVQTDGGPFFGTLQTPATCGPYPLVLLFAGSGPTNQDGNDSAAGLATDGYRLLASGLAANGIASVRYDKRCVGRSVCGISDEATFTFDADVADGQRWAEHYAHDPRFTGLILAGHSEGALWATLIAQRVPVVAVVSLEGAGRLLGEVLQEQLAKQLGASSSLLAQADSILASLEAGIAVASIPQPLLALLGPAVQPYLISWMRYDPAAEIAKLAQPVLVVQGTTDAQVDVQDAELLAAANPRAQLLLIQGMCHVLKDAPLPLAAQTRAYSDPTLPLDPMLVSGIASFVQRL